MFLSVLWIKEMFMLGCSKWCRPAPTSLPGRDPCCAYIALMASTGVVLCSSARSHPADAFFDVKRCCIAASHSGYNISPISYITTLFNVTQHSVRAGVYEAVDQHFVDMKGSAGWIGCWNNFLSALKLYNLCIIWVSI